MNNDFLSEYRQGAEIHRQVRQWAQKNIIKPGKSLTEIAEGIEDSVRALTGHMGLEEGDSLIAGMGFPTGLNINHCAAHDSPNAGNKTILQQGDVMKVDIGVHVNGRIVDSAFTVAFDPVYDNLLEAVKDATNTGVRVIFPSFESPLLPDILDMLVLTWLSGSWYRCPHERYWSCHPRDDGELRNRTKRDDLSD